MVATILTGAAESNRAVLRYIPEVTWGTIPANGVVKSMRITASGLTGKKATKLSEEIRADRMVSNIIEVSASTDGDVDWELSAGGQDDFWEHFLLSAWTRPMNYLLVKGASVSVTGASQITLAGKDWRDWITVNQFIKLEGFLTLANNGYFKVTVKAFTAGNTVLTVQESSLVIEAGSSFTKLSDANDVILKSTLTAIEATNKINGGGANSFAGQTLKVGQKIYVEGLGKETGALAINAALATNGEEFILSDGVDPLTFEFATSAALIEPGHVFVLIDADPSVQADKIVTAVNDQFRRQNFRLTSTKTAGVKQTGNVTFTTPADNGDTVTVFDGRSTAVFTFAASGDSGTGAAVQVATGATATDSASNLRSALNANVLIQVTAAGAGTSVDITNDLYTGGSITKSDADNDYAVTNFNAGTAPAASLKNHRNTGGVITESLAAITATAFSGGSATKGGFLTIAALPDDDSIVVSETLTNDANGGGLTVVIKGSHIRNPGDPLQIIKKSMSAETGFTDVDKYLTHTGLRLGSFKKTLAPGDIVKGQFSFMGRETIPQEDTVLGQTPTYTLLDTTATEVFNATSNVGNVLRNGEALQTAIMKLDIQGDAALREQKAVGAKFPAGIGYGRFVLKGTISAYFQNFDLYNDFYQHTTASLAWDLEDADHNKYFYTVPSIKFLSDPIAPEGIDKDVMEDIQWNAQRDVTLETMFMIDRFSSVWPSAVA